MLTRLLSSSLAKTYRSSILFKSAKSKKTWLISASQNSLLSQGVKKFNNINLFNKSIPKRFCASQPKSTNVFDDLLNAYGDEVLHESRTPEQLAQLIVRVYPTLDRVLKLDLISSQPAPVIKDVWKKYHEGRYCLSSVIEPAIWERIQQKVSAYPVYVVVSPRKNGAFEFFYFQQRDNTWMFTPIQEMKDKGEEAEAAMIVGFYDELADSKGLVLMRASINPYALSVSEAKFLLNRVQASYLDEDLYKVVKDFHREPNKFDWQRLVSDLPVPGTPTDLANEASGHVHGPGCSHNHDHHDTHVHGPNCNHDHDHTHSHSHEVTDEHIHGPECSHGYDHDHVHHQAAHVHGPNCNHDHDDSHHRHHQHHSHNAESAQAATKRKKPSL